jgi:hypothetical protein
MSKLLVLVPAALVFALAVHSRRDRDPPRADPGEQIATISRGENVRLSDYLVPGQRTVFEYTADW